MKYAGAIFDMDGLLFDTENIFQQTWREIAQERGITLATDFVRAICGTSGEHMNRVIEAYYGVPDGSGIQADCMARVRKKLREDVPVKPGVHELLEYFRKKDVRLAVASSSYEEQIESNLKIAGIRSYFDAIVSGKEVRHGKPAPDIFLLAAEKIGCRPQECYVFEDSSNGIRAGHAAGCTSIMIPDLIAPDEEMYELSDGIYDSLSEALRQLKESLSS